MRNAARAQVTRRRRHCGRGLRRGGGGSASAGGRERWITLYYVVDAGDGATAAARGVRLHTVIGGCTKRAGNVAFGTGRR